jgi:hypothetical protein
MPEPESSKFWTRLAFTGLRSRASRHTTAASLEASTYSPESGQPSANNSVGASAAIAEITPYLDSLFEAQGPDASECPETPSILPSYRDLTGPVKVTSLLISSILNCS